MFDAPHSAGTHALMQDPAFEAALRLCGQTPLRLSCGLLILRRRLFGLRVVMLPRAVPPADLRDRLRSHGLRRAPFILSPEVTCALPAGVPIARPKRRAVLPLVIDRDRQRRQLHGKWRNQLRHAERQGMTITIARLSADPDASVLRQETRQARTRGYLNWPAPLTAAFARVAPQQTCLVTAQLGKVDLGHMLFLLHGFRATYHIGHLTNAGRRTCAHNLILWGAMRELAERGYSEIDLGVVEDGAPGVDHFKKRTGASNIPTGGTRLTWQN